MPHALQWTRSTLSLRPLLAERIDLRECETFFFGTASRMPSHNEPRLQLLDDPSADSAKAEPEVSAGAHDSAGVNGGVEDQDEGVTNRAGIRKRRSMVE